jgi:hypothetical protein
MTAKLEVQVVGDETGHPTTALLNGLGRLCLPGPLVQFAESVRLDRGGVKQANLVASTESPVGYQAESARTRPRRGSIAGPGGPGGRSPGSGMGEAAPGGDGAAVAASWQSRQRLRVMVMAAGPRRGRRAAAHRRGVQFEVDSIWNLLEG